MYLILFLLHELNSSSNTITTKVLPYNKSGALLNLERELSFLITYFGVFCGCGRLVCFRFRVGLLAGGGLGVGMGLGGAFGR